MWYAQIINSIWAYRIWNEKKKKSKEKFLAENNERCLV